MKKEKVKAWIYLVVLSIIWGASYLLIKIALEDRDGNQRLPAEQLGALRMSFAFLALTPFLIKSIKLVKRKHIIFLIMSGVFGNGLPAFLFAYAESRLNSSITGMLNSLVPLFTILIAAIIFKFKIKTNHIIGITIGVGGAVLIVYNKLFGVQFSKEDVPALLMVVAATMCYATSLNVIKYKLGEVDSKAITTISFAFVGPFCMIYLAFTDFFTRLSTQPNIYEGVGAVAVLAVLGTALAVLMFNNMIKLSSAVFASSVTYFIPVVAILLGIFYGEEVSPIQLLGMLTLIVGVLVINRK